jgi:hypothetical protein
MLRATECLLATHLELRPIPTPTPAVLAGVRIVLTEPSSSLLGAETVVQNFSTQPLMVLKSGNFAYLRRPNFRCVTIIYIFFFKRLYVQRSVRTRTLIHFFPAEGFSAFTLIHSPFLPEYYEWTLPPSPRIIPRQVYIPSHAVTGCVYKMSTTLLNM